jgi:hypothetical protein
LTPSGGFVRRRTQLYDPERSFNSTLEMDDLLPLITSKQRERQNAGIAGEEKLFNIRKHPSSL